MGKRKYIYLAEDECFGYILQCIGLSEEEVKEAMINKNEKKYKEENGIDVENEDEYLLTTFIENLYVEKREINKVKWT